MKTQENSFKDWFLHGIKPTDTQSHHQDVWWKVLCLTGVDYFSTLGYQPGIAFLAAGVLSPLATLVLVLVTLFGALPVYCVVAKESPHGQGSVAMLERMLPGWRGKTLVLLLLGFAATAFIITITLSAADATAHIIENPLIPQALHNHNRIAVTMFLLTMLGALFLKGFREAIGVSFIIVVIYLALSAVIIIDGFVVIAQNPHVLNDWLNALNTAYPSSSIMLGAAMIAFPQLALGLSGFETGVAVMPLVKGDKTDTQEEPTGRIRNARYLLATAAIVMCFYLVSSSVVTTVLIPAQLFQPGGAANGRALAYLAHTHLGDFFGSIYDFSTIAILWFAGASAIAGLLSLVPKYLPRYGMAPGWAAAIRPLVVFFIVVAYAVTAIFQADVDKQAGAYATGVLVLITSAAVASTIAMAKKGGAAVLFCLVSIVFIYTTVVNMSQRTEGIAIASFFVVSILISSLLSRAVRSTELRIEKVQFDKHALDFIQYAMEHDWGEIRILANRSGSGGYKDKEALARHKHSIQSVEGDFIFLEVELSDASEFSEDCLEVTGHEIDGYRVLRCDSPAVPNAIAAILLEIRNRTKKIPHVYLGWTEGHPMTYAVRYIFWGEGETAPLTREILRSAEPDEIRRPLVHVS